jgi:sterol desaturase/sphingolipid hydroxylase (fatty acid hydroxylase superfamily)
MHSSATACPKCGAPVKAAAAADKPPVYTSFDQVPWFRKRWFVVLCAVIFIPAALVIAFTGPIYKLQGGQVQAFPKHQKWVLLGVFIALVVLNLLSGS